MCESVCLFYHNHSYIGHRVKGINIKDKNIIRDIFIPYILQSNYVNMSDCQIDSAGDPDSMTPDK